MKYNVQGEAVLTPKKRETSNILGIVLVVSAIAISITVLLWHYTNKESLEIIFQ